jgi:hypothetical protein
MTNISGYPLKVLKALYGIYDPESSVFGRNWNIFPLKDYSNQLIFDVILDDKPAMVGRLGSSELTCMVNYLGVKEKWKYKSKKQFVLGKSPAWWWNDTVIKQMCNCAGFFPGEVSYIEQFCEMMISELKEVDILGSWLKYERFFDNQLSNSRKVMLEDLEPFFAEKPWTWALKGKKVLVIHPFAEQIESQYVNREKLFANGLLPSFELVTIKAVQSIAGEQTSYNTWFDALDSMKEEISKVDFEVCIIGCGAYGFPLASYVKRLGKKAIHLGGVTQLLFGIKGARWDDYIVYPYTNLYNEYWVRPLASLTPQNALSVEGACYW